MNLENPDSEMAIYVLLRAVDKFHSQYNRFPGEYDNEREADVHKLTVSSTLGFIPTFRA